MAESIKPWTPGKWFIEADERNRKCFYVTSKNNGEIIARMFGRDRRPFGHALQNARLITAAPEMAEALERLIACTAETRSQADAIARRDAKRQARLALMKAGAVT